MTRTGDIGDIRIGTCFGLYVLVGGQPQVTTDPLTWAEWFMGTNRVVSDSIIDPVQHEGDDGTDKATRISTVFTGVGQGPDANGAVLLWETMVFGYSALAGSREHYASEAAARAGHEQWVERVRAGSTERTSA